MTFQRLSGRLYGVTAVTAAAVRTTSAADSTVEADICPPRKSKRWAAKCAEVEARSDPSEDDDPKLTQSGQAVAQQLYIWEEQ